MQQVLRRRLTHFKNGDAGFDERPDALLIDGGIEHANAVLQVLNELGLAIPTFGMVKDNRHRTRALVTPQEMKYPFLRPRRSFSHRNDSGGDAPVRHYLSPYAPQPPRPGLEAKRFPVSGRSSRETLLKTFSRCAPLKTQSLTALGHAIGKAAGQAVCDYSTKTGGNAVESLPEVPGVWRSKHPGHGHAPDHGSS